MAVVSPQHQETTSNACQAGKASVTLQLDLGHSVPHQQHVHTTARDRRRLRRADARKVNASETEEATKTIGSDKEKKELNADAEKVDAFKGTVATKKEAGKVA
jgi:hypothetical protein